MRQVDRLERYFPKWNATGDITWKLNKVTVNYGISWFSKTRRYDVETLTGNPDIAAPQYLWLKEKWQHDVYVAFDVNEKFRFFVGSNNVFNQQPDLGQDNYPVSFVGRYMYAGAKIVM